MKFAGARGITRSRVPLIAMLALAATIGLAGCEGDDGKDGAPGTNGTNGAPGATGPAGPTGPAGATGPTGPTGPVAGIEKPLESCAVCHGENSLAAVDEAHALTGGDDVSVSSVTPRVVGNDLVVTFKVAVDGADPGTFDKLYVSTRSGIYAYRLSEVPASNPVEYTRAQYTSLDPDAALTGPVAGVYTITVPGIATTDATVPSTYYFRITNPAGIRVGLGFDFPSTPKPLAVSNQACINCHGSSGQGMHNGDPLSAQVCAVCHNATDNVVEGTGVFVNLIHGIHNSHNMPGGEFVFAEDDPATAGDERETFEVSYPTYMTNCSVCHDSDATLSAANSMPASYAGCTSCHGSMEGFGFAAGNFHLNIVDDTLPCTNCHVAPVLPATVADFHNGLETERVGIIWDGEDQSVAIGEKFTWKIDNIVDDGTNLKISWSATFDKDGTGPGAPVAINPCNTTATADAPIIYPYAPNTAGEGTAGMLRSYVQGDDYVLGKATSPGQATTTNLTTANTVCAGNVATTTIPVEAGVAKGTRGVVALVGKWQVPVPAGFADSLHAADWPYTLQFVRVPTPTEEWIVGSSGIVAKASQRREIADTTACLKCHVGSLYQHGNTRVDNVTMCTICHNSASSDQNNRVAMGVDKTEAYDGLVGQTYEFKSMLHALHAVNNEALNPQKAPVLIYRTRGIFAWAPEGVTPPNWPAGPTNCVNTGTGPGHVVFGAADPAANVSCQTHNLYHPTYPRLANDCAACHEAGFDTMVDQTKGVATTLDAGVAPWTNQLDDTLQGANTAACTSCHQDSASGGHANQNSWVPTKFPNGRQTIIDAAK